jgi:O-antigen/teichoic acid export membrane protein
MLENITKLYEKKKGILWRFKIILLVSVILSWVFFIIALSMNDKMIALPIIISFFVTVLSIHGLVKRGYFGKNAVPMLYAIIMLELFLVIFYA